jgi:hypothetical protein
LSKSAKRKARVLATNRVNISPKLIAGKLEFDGDCSVAPSKWTVVRALRVGRKNITFGGVSTVTELPNHVKANRLKFCRAVRDRSWKDVLVLDSKVFPMDRGTKGKRWHYAGKTMKRTGIKEKRQLHVYGAACIHGVTPLRAVTGTSGLATHYKTKKGLASRGVGYQEFIDVLKDTIIPAARRLFKGRKFTILMDRAPAHSTPEVKQFIHQNGLTFIQGWPGNSPDLNWVENLWSIVENRLVGRRHKSLKAWKRSVNKEWHSIPSEVLKKCAGSMGRRMRLCIKRQGGHTGY